MKRKHYKYKNISGFTIVELLIVVVVIGILAAIVTVAYNGIQDKARNASYSTAIDSFTKALTAYKNEFNNYPSTVQYDGSGNPTSYAFICLGNKYPATSTFPLNGCYIASASTYPNYNTSTVLNDAISKYLTSQPDTSMLISPNTVQRGLLYQSLNSDSSRAAITYNIKGDQTCARGVKSSATFNSTPGTVCTLTLE